MGDTSHLRDWCVGDFGGLVTDIIQQALELPGTKSNLVRSRGFVAGEMGVGALMSVLVWVN